MLAVDDNRPTFGSWTPCWPRAGTASTPPRRAGGLAALDEHDIDLVLLDILMPGMDGYEVCRRIRAHPRTAFLPVVMITASGAQQRLAALEAGADDFVTKPFDQSEALARVASLADQALPRHRRATGRGG